MKIKLKKNNFPKEVRSYILHRADGFSTPQLTDVWRNKDGIFLVGYGNLLKDIEEDSLWSDRIEFV